MQWCWCGCWSVGGLGSGNGELFIQQDVLSVAEVVTVVMVVSLVAVCVDGNIIPLRYKGGCGGVKILSVIGCKGEEKMEQDKSSTSLDQQISR